MEETKPTIDDNPLFDFIDRKGKEDPDAFLFFRQVEAGKSGDIRKYPLNVTVGDLISFQAQTLKWVQAELIEFMAASSVLKFDLDDLRRAFDKLHQNWNDERFEKAEWKKKYLEIQMPKTQGKSPDVPQHILEQLRKMSKTAPRFKKTGKIRYKAWAKVLGKDIKQIGKRKPDEKILADICEKNDIT